MPDLLLRYYGQLLCLLFLSLPMYAQHTASFNLNADNGLLSNHIYGLTTDHLGYLWIATDRGVLKYNGYDCISFTTADGLPSDDVWGLLEDKKGRMWLSTIADHVGYIHENKYKNAISDKISGTFYPIMMSPIDSGIYFSSTHLNGLTSAIICMERNDTIFPFELSDEKFHYKFKTNDIGASIHSGTKKYVFYKRNGFRLDNLHLAIDAPEKVAMTLLPKLTWEIIQKYISGVSTGYITINIDGNFLCYIPYFSKSLLRLNPETSIIDTINLKPLGFNEEIEYISIGKDSSCEIIHIYSSKKILSLGIKDAKIVKHSTISIAEATSGKGENIKVTCNTNQSIWDICIGTNDHGTFITRDCIPSKLSIPEFLKLYRPLGTANGYKYWYSNATKTLLLLQNNKAVKEFHINTNVENVISYNNDTVIISGQHVYYLNTKTMILSNALMTDYGTNIRKIIRGTAKNYFIIARTGAYFVADDDDKSKRSGFNHIGTEWYEGAGYYSCENAIVAFTRKKISLFNATNGTPDTNSIFYHRIFNRIKGVSLDNRYCHMYIQTNDTLYRYNSATKTINTIDININFANCNIQIVNDQLILYGDIGVYFYLILPDGSLTKPITYNNFKKLRYRSIDKLYILDSSLLIHTDKGQLSLQIPDRDLFFKNASNYTDRKILLAKVGTHTRHISHKDTLELSQKNKFISMDVINPYGNGKLAVYYLTRKNGNWEKSTSSEVILPESFKPDRYNKIWVYFKDDGWKSDVIELTVYITPLWWQTRKAQRLFWIGGILLGIAIVSLAIFVTRRIVTKANEKRNLQRELELKAIYAQINPHFIFNTLTSALLLVSKNRMDEAYVHISKFSKLLRSYLKSSRNKFITLAEEIENLKNYTELQQTRFKERFRCDITVDDSLDTESEKIPSLLIQPFVENAINHGILYSENQGYLTISFKKIAHGVACTVSDNGIGRKKSLEAKNNQENILGSYGNMMIKDLVEIFNKYEDMTISINYEDHEPSGTGTTVKILIIKQ